MRHHTSILLSLCILNLVGACATGEYGSDDPVWASEMSGAELYEKTRQREGLEGASQAVLAQYTSAWENGSVAAAKRLAEMSLHGYGGRPVDHVEAVLWLTRAADGGDLESRYNLGCMLYFGHGVEQSAATAAEHWMIAANGDFAAAQTNLGALYFSGNGVPQNHTAASGWFERAAQRGDAIGQYKFALACKNGYGIEPDNIATLRWMFSAASQGLKDAQHDMGKFCESGLGMEPDRIAAAHWYWRAAENGHEAARNEFERVDLELRLEADFGGARGMCYRGYALREGIGADADPAAAFTWFERAAQGNDPQGTFELARCYADGLGVMRDVQRAIDTCAAAARLGHAAAGYEVALIIQSIDGFSAENHERAMAWMRGAAEHGHVAARLHLDQESNFALALSGKPENQRSVGCSFIDGRLQRTDYAAARYWLELAHQQSDSYSSLALGKLLLAGGESVTLLGRTTFEPDPLGAVRALEEIRQAYEFLDGETLDKIYTESRTLLALISADPKSPAYDLERAILNANLAASVYGDYTSIPVVQAEVDRVEDAEFDQLLATPRESDPFIEPSCGFCGGTGLVISVRGHYVGRQYWGDQYTTCLTCKGTGLLYHLGVR